MPKKKIQTASEETSVVVEGEAEVEVVTAEKPKRARKKKEETLAEEPKKRSSGLRSAVRYGEITAQEALAKLRSEGAADNSAIMRWLRHR